MADFDYSKIDVEEMLNELSIRNVKDIGGGEIKYSCPFPGHSHGDANPSASMQQGTTAAHCFGCGWSGNAVTFVSEYEGVSPLKARRWLRERFGINAPDIEGSVSEYIEQQLVKAPSKAKPELQKISYTELWKREVDWESVWDVWFSPDKADSYPLGYMLDRGFYPETLTTWNIGWDRHSQRISIPAFIEKNQLVGFKGRSVDSLPKYLVLGGEGYEFDTYEVGLVLFGINHAEKHIKEAKSIIVVEGELNAIAMHQAGFKNCVGISGKSISNVQASKIKELADSATLIFDEPDDAFKAALRLEGTMPVKIALEHEKDPADSSPEEISELLDACCPTVLLR